MTPVSSYNGQFICLVARGGEQSARQPQRRALATLLRQSAQPVAPLTHAKHPAHSEDSLRSKAFSKEPNQRQAFLVSEISANPFKGCSESRAFRAHGKPLDHRNDYLKFFVAVSEFLFRSNFDNRRSAQDSRIKRADDQRKAAGTEAGGWKAID